MATSAQGWMDVSEDATRIAYTATAGQTLFIVPFQFVDEDHVQVYVNDVLQTKTTNYTISGEGDEDGGSITLLSAASALDSVVIALAVPYELTTHIPLSGQLDVAAINLQFTLFTLMLKQLVADQSRSLRQPASDEDDLEELGTASERASKYLAFDVDGQPSLVASVTSAVAATAFALTLLDDTSAAQARNTLGITDVSAYAAVSNWNFCS